MDFNADKFSNTPKKGTVVPTYNNIETLQKFIFSLDIKAIPIIEMYGILANDKL